MEVALETVSATEFKNRLGSYLQGIAREPVVIEKSGRPVAVMLSSAEYDRLLHFEDYFWGEEGSGRWSRASSWAPRSR